jgi:hypothetical protein
MGKKKRKSSTTATDVSYQDLNENELNLPEEISDVTVSRKRKMSESLIISKEKDINKCSRTKLDKQVQSNPLKQSKGIKKSSNEESDTVSQFRNKASICIYHVEYIQGQI